jgi:dTDP-glucose 4,6-dehydratase
LLHVSTDEVYGSLPLDGGYFDETSPYAPNSPYAASKAAADHLAGAWWRTYGLPVIISNCSNNYGPYQFPEKLIPTAIIAALEDLPVPVYGTGANIRHWLYVDDHVRALLMILERGTIGRTYAVGGNAEVSNIDLVRRICAALDELMPAAPSRPHAHLITFVDDRPGHDFRYAIDDRRLRNELGWVPTEDFDSGLRKTIVWYLEHREWWSRLRRERYDGRRLGRVADANA